MRKNMSLLLIVLLLVGLHQMNAFATGAAPELPDGYVQVEYVESHGQEWIDTGVIPTGKTRSEVDFQVTVADPAASMGIYGVYRSSRHQILYSVGSDLMTYGVGKGYAGTALDTSRHTAILDAKETHVMLDGISMPSVNGNDYTSTGATASIYLFGAHQTSQYSSYARIYDVKIYENGILAHHYVPCYCEAGIEYGMYDVIAGAFLGNSSGAGQLTGPNGAVEASIALTAPKAVKIKVFGGFDETTTGSLICVRQETVDDLTTYYYDLPAGKYHYTAEGNGYNSVHKNFIVTPDELTEGGKQINANPGLRSAGKKYECKSLIYSFTDELLSSDLMSLDSLLLRFPDLLDTPAFSPEKAFAEFTSQTELEAFLTSVDDQNDDVYIYTAGKTGKGKTIYLSIHTQENLSDLSLEEAAARLRENGKPTVCIYGLIHGLEPSGGEGALAMIQALDGAYGETVLRDINVIIMPWINGDGAESYIYGTPSGCSNLNRYNLTVDYPELRATHSVYNLFLPEVVISAHEKRFQLNGALDEAGTLMDASLDISVNRNNSDQLRQLSKEMMQTVIEDSAVEGFRMDRHEQDNVSGQYPIVGNNYFGLRGSVSVLVEVPGIRAGKDLYGRSVAAQFVAAKNILEYVCDNQKQILSVIAAERAATVARGSTFDPDTLLTLRHGRNETPSWTIHTPVYHFTDGTLLDASATTPVIFWEKALVTRSCPTAYVIPADAQNIAYILRAAAYNAIEYDFLTAEESVLLRRYGGTVNAAILGEEALCRFENGAYVFTMDQPSANALAMLMEPDVFRSDSYAVSFAQAGKLSIDEIYRCEQDLVNGKISIVKTEHTYTATVTAPTCTEKGYTTYTCSCGDSYVDDYVDALGHSYENGICTVCGTYYVNFQSATISLAGNIAINFYVELGQPILDDESAFMSFTLPDGTTKTAMLSDAEVSVKNGVTRYVFTCEVHAKQMADMVVAQMHLGDGAAVGDSRSYSVVTYAGYIIAHEDQYAAYPSLVNLLKTMLNYGAYSQIHFGYNVNNLANAGLNLTLNDVTRDDVSAYRPKRAGSMTGLEITSVTLILRSETVLRFYYTLASGCSIEDYNFVVNGQAVRPIYNQDNGRYYVDVTNIAAKDLDREYGVTVTNKAGTESLSVIASAMSYVYQVIASPSYFTEDVKDVVKAMYAYNIAANAYFK